MRSLRIFVLALSLAAAATAQQAGDLVIINGKVITMDAGRTAESIAIVGNKIAAVGKLSELKGFISERTRVIDARGGTVLPGFNDSHVHFMAIANLFSALDLKPINTRDQLLERIRNYARFLPKGRWIIASGGSNELFEQISGGDLDAEAPDHPVFLYRVGGRSALANSGAFRAAGIKEPVPGSVSGPVFDRIKFAIPRDHTRSWEAMAETASSYAASFGITSVQDTDSDDHISVYRKLAREGKLKVRVYDCHGLPRWKEYAAAGLKAASGDAMVRGGCLKGTADVDGGPTATLFKNVADADKAGFQILLHAIGPEMVKTALDAFDAAAKANGSRDRRPRIEHAERAAESEIERIRAYGTIVSIQPYLFHPMQPFDPYYDRFAADGDRVALGSDAPMTEIDPLLTLAGETVGPGSRFTRMNAIAGYTTGAAFAEFQESVKGRIAPGMLADIVILSGDLFLPAAHDRGRPRVLMTIMDGRLTYTAAAP